VSTIELWPYLSQVLPSFRSKTLDRSPALVRICQTESSCRSADEHITFEGASNHDCRSMYREVAQ